MYANAKKKLERYRVDNTSYQAELAGKEVDKYSTNALHVRVHAAAHADVASDYFLQIPHMR